MPIVAELGRDPGKPEVRAVHNIIKRSPPGRNTGRVVRPELSLLKPVVCMAC